MDHPATMMCDDIVCDFICDVCNGDLDFSVGVQGSFKCPRMGIGYVLLVVLDSYRQASVLQSPQ